MEKIVILTGAGISAESGLSTFRDEGGLWAQHRIEDVATPEAFARNPALVQGFYNARRVQAAQVHPNSAHRALARLQQNWPGDVVIVTQNVDGLHEAGGAKAVIHMHGILSGALCAACDHRWTAPPEMAPDEPCPACDAPSGRPDIVWFGEMPMQMERIEMALANCDLFVSIGTSGNVYPAAGFVAAAQRAGASTRSLNLDPSNNESAFDNAEYGLATKLVPEFVERVLGS